MRRPKNHIQLADLQDAARALETAFRKLKAGGEANLSMRASALLRELELTHITTTEGN